MFSHNTAVITTISTGALTIVLIGMFVWIMSDLATAQICQRQAYDASLVGEPAPTFPYHTIQAPIERCERILGQ